MASKHGLKSRKQSSSTSKHAISPPSSATSSSKLFPETSHDGESSPVSSSVRSKLHSSYSVNTVFDAERIRENVTVTVRFRPLSPREIRQGEEIAWYADGETIVRNENNASLAYAYDRVFGPTTTTRQVYDIAAQHVVNGAMEGVTGTIFAYGVTSSGKTHTMHGDQRSPGIIPLAVKDAFSIIQETPSREYLLRVSYLEIYNEVVNDLLNPSRQNLRIREDAQGTFVEGIKEEVVLSPAHALSLIAAGEEHRHVGSTHFNLLSSRSHTIFTLTVESSPCGNNRHEEAVNYSQLNLIDLAGSESSRAKTTGVRQREGSYINKSLLTLGTVISKLTDGKASHIPYRDSKLTRLLQSSLSGHGRVSLICTVTPSSSNSEETHNTLKFARRAKHIEIQAAQNKIIDEKSLIKKYQNEIRCLKEELEQLKKGIIRVEQMKEMSDNDLVLLRQKLGDGQFKLQWSLEQEEEAKAALLGRIQRLTKLILVSSKVPQSSRFPLHSGPQRRHSFGEEELAYLPHRRRDITLDGENVNLFASSGDNDANSNCTAVEEKKSRKTGLLNWLKPRKRDSGLAAPITSDKSSEVKSMLSTPNAESASFQRESRPASLPAESVQLENHSLQSRLGREFSEDCRLEQETPERSGVTTDAIDLLWEKRKTLTGQVALQERRLQLLAEEAAWQPVNGQICVEMEELSDEIKDNCKQIALFEKEIANSFIFGQEKAGNFNMSRSLDELVLQLNEKAFELEVKTADNRILQEQLGQKTRECERLQEAVDSLKQQLAGSKISNPEVPHPQCYFGEKNPENGFFTHIQAESFQIEELKHRVAELTDSKEQLELRSLRLAEEGSYAKGLASAAAIELKALSGEVSKLMTHNERLASEIVSLKSPHTHRRTVQNGRRDSSVPKRRDTAGSPSDTRRELAVLQERALSLEAALAEKDEREAELQREAEECRQRESDLENELANMWVLVAKLKARNVDDDFALDAKVTDSFDEWGNTAGINNFQ